MIHKIFISSLGLHTDIFASCNLFTYKQQEILEAVLEDTCRDYIAREEQILIPHELLSSNPQGLSYTDQDLHL